ncbi:GNAT family N-acetyltransferase [Leuconostoc citreum]|uniref:GNAT family N-acetyltransferase n=1 Tax=Leuconostoc citreum TaxID=33964 RepID=UPI000BFEBE10|nr:GNAT family protein [Leuconostoc citreum]
MFSFKYDDDVSLSLPLPDNDAEALFALVENSRTTLAQWLPWANRLTSVDDEKNFLQKTLTHFGTGGSLNCVIRYRNEPVGMISFNTINKKRQQADIGYWLGNQWHHKNIMHRAVTALMTIGFDEYKLRKIIINVDVHNDASNHVAQKLNCHLDGTKREDTSYGNDIFADMNEWTILRSEWESRK